MSIHEKIKSEVIIAMKAKDKQLVQVLKNVKGKLDNEAKSKLVETLTDDNAQKVIQKYVKERKESLLVAQKAKRPDLIANEEYEIEVFSKYLPKILSEQETRDIVSELIKNGANNIGAIMGQINKYGNSIDKGLVSKIAKELV